MSKVLRIYGEISGNRKLYNDSIAQKMKTHIQAIQNDEFFKNNLGQLWNGMTDKHRENITSFIK
jgi:hypothetical protein